MVETHVRLVVSARPHGSELVAPGFSSLGFVSALIAAVVITVAGYLIEALLVRAFPIRSRDRWIPCVSCRDIRSSILHAGYGDLHFGSIIAAFVIGLIDMFVPTIEVSGDSPTVLPLFATLLS